MSIEIAELSAEQTNLTGFLLHQVAVHCHQENPKAKVFDFAMLHGIDPNTKTLTTEEFERVIKILGAEKITVSVE